MITWFLRNYFQAWLADWPQSSHKAGWDTTSISVYSYIISIICVMFYFTSFDLQLLVITLVEIEDCAFSLILSVKSFSDRENKNHNLISGLNCELSSWCNFWNTVCSTELRADTWLWDNFGNLKKPSCRAQKVRK